MSFRLHRGSIIGWAVFLLVWGFANGIIVEPIVDGLQNLSTEVMELFGGDGGIVIDSYLATMGLYDAAMVAIFVVLGVLSTRSEEYGGRTEPVLATAASRWDWLGSHLLVIAIGSSVLLTLSGLGMGLGAAMGVGDPGLIWQVAAGHLAFLPALLVFLTVAGLLYGLVPGAVGLAWIPVAYAFVMGLFAPVWDLPQWVLNLSVFEHIPEIPVDDFAVVPLLVLTVLALAVAIAGLTAFRNRDLTAT